MWKALWHRFEALLGTMDMPKDWNDHLGWERYYRQFRRHPPHRYRQFSHSDNMMFLEIFDHCLSLGSFLQFVQYMKGQKHTSVWVPGCGMSPLAKLLAHLGFTVVATDIAKSAVEFQVSKYNDISRFIQRLGPEVQGGSLTAEVHDFRSAFRVEAFDLVLNIRAFQKFALADMQGIARVHAQALRPGGCACFDTMNSVSFRDRIESALEAGGFVVPPSGQAPQWEYPAIHQQINTLKMRMNHLPEHDGTANGRGDTVAYLAGMISELERWKEVNVGPGAKVAWVTYGSG